MHEKLQSCINPLDADVHSDGIVNIVTDRIAPDRANVDKSIEIGQKEMISF